MCVLFAYIKYARPTLLFCRRAGRTNKNENMYIKLQIQKHVEGNAQNIQNTRDTDSDRDREAKPHINKNTASVHINAASAAAAAAVAVPQHTLSLSGARIWCGGTRGEDTSTHGGKDTRTDRRHTNAHTHTHMQSERQFKPTKPNNNSLASPSARGQRQVQTEKCYSLWPQQLLLLLLPALLPTPKSAAAARSLFAFDLCAHSANSKC